MTGSVPPSAGGEPEPLGPMAPSEAPGPAARAYEGFEFRPVTGPPTARVFSPRLIGGLAVAAVFGVVFGLAAPRIFEHRSPPVRDAATRAAIADAGPGLQVQVETPRPVPAPLTSRMETPVADDSLPAAAAPRPAPSEPVRAAPEPPSDFIEDLAQRRSRDLEPADPACAYAAAHPDSGCTDAELIQADRVLTDAYRVAGRAGVSPQALRADARDWRGVSEDAGARSRAALLDAYQARAEDVLAMAESVDRDDRFGRR